MACTQSEVNWASDVYKGERPDHVIWLADHQRCNDTKRTHTNSGHL